MASVVYPKLKEALLKGTSLDLTAVNIRAIFVDLADYTYSAAHDFLDDVPGAARVAVSGNLASVTVSAAGVVDCADYSVAGVSGDQFEAVIYYVHTGTEATSRLLCFADSGTGIPYTPNGGGIDVQVNASGIMAL
jgi:hypothetical protein